MEVIVERNCRLKRALILSLKKTELSEEMQAKQTPFLQYLQVSGPDVKLGYTPQQNPAQSTTQMHRLQPIAT